jgi:hypothetical protein
MNTSPGTVARVLCVATVLSVCIDPPAALAQEGLIEEIVITGTRRAGLSPT